MMSASTSTKDPLVPPSSTSSSNSPSWIYNKTLRYCWMLVGCVVAVLMETLIWRRFISKTCGSYCSLKYKLLFVFVLYVFTISHPFSSNKEDIYFKYANELVSFDYSKMGNLQYPAGVLYFYRLVKWILSSVNDHQYRDILKTALPVGLFLYSMLCSAYLMKRCRIPAGLMIFFAVPLGLLVQGHALMFILPEMLGMTVLLQALAALVAGYDRISILLLAGAMSFDAVTVLPLLPAFMLCLMRTMGLRCTMLWMFLAGLGLILISGQFLLSNPTSYLSQSMGLRGSTWNPIVWFLNLAHPPMSKGLERIFESALPGIFIQCLAQLYLISRRWLKSDGGIIGLFAKVMKSSRGHGIRPNPWTPRQALTVIFESMLVSVLLQFPSLAHAEEFEVLTVMISGFFCVVLGDAVPLPALFGIFSALSFPLTFLYRQFIFSDGNSKMDSSLHFHPNLQESLHLLPMLSLPVAQMAVLILFKRRDISGPTIPVGPFPVHRRSSSLSRRKID